MDVIDQLDAPAGLPLEEDPPAIHWIEGLVGPRDGLDAAAKKKRNFVAAPAGNQIPDVQPIT
jgi:hypothetical protein